MLGNSVSINDLCYNDVDLKKNKNVNKTFKNCSFKTQMVFHG